MKWLIVLVATFALGASAAHAQRMLELIDDLGITGDDYRTMQEEARQLYTAESPQAGDERDWTNPETGTRGTVELTAFDGTCATIAHSIKSGETHEVHRFTMRRCRNPDGRWLVSD